MYDPRGTGPKMIKKTSRKLLLESEKSDEIKN